MGAGEKDKGSGYLDLHLMPCIGKQRMANMLWEKEKGENWSLQKSVVNSMAVLIGHGLAISHHRNQKVLQIRDL